MLRRIALVVRVLLEADELDVDRVEMLAGLGQKLAQKIVHDDDSNSTRRNTNVARSLAG